MRKHLTRARIAVGGALVLATALLLPALPATALPASIFELDANSVDNAAAGEDWNTLFNDTTGPAGSSVAFTGIDADPAGTTIFTTGGSKDFADIPSWRHTTGSVPDKDEITNAYAAAYLAPDGADPGTEQDLIVYFGADRYAQNGSANVGFWFLEQQVGPVAAGLFSGAHVAGDTLVLSEFTNGGAVSTIQVWEWNPTVNGPTCPSSVTNANVGCKDNAGTMLLKLASANADCDTAAPSENACANVNAEAITVPWPYDAKGGGDQQGAVPIGGFFEGGVNLSALRGGTQPCVSSFIAETRSSPSIDAVLKDFTGGGFPLCSASISIGPDDVNDVNDPHTFTVTVSRVFAGTSSGISGVNPSVTLTDSGGATITPTANTCATTGTNASGQCTVTFTSAVAGVITGHATVTATVQGQTFNLSTGSGAGQNPDATKVYVDGKVSITPTAVNGIGESHTFTVEALQKIGSASAFSAATDGHATVTLTDAGGAVKQLDATASTCDDAGDNLDANGKCVMVFKSDVAGTVTGHASVDMNLTTSEGNITITRQTNGLAGNTGDAVKTYVDGEIVWLKHDDLGNLLGGAVFTVCKTHSWSTTGNTGTGEMVDLVPDACFDVTDDSAPDTDSTPGEFKLVDLTLGRYTIKEKTAPPGYALDPDTVTVNLDTTNVPTSNNGNAGTFVDPALFKVIIYTCNTSTEQLVVSQVDEDPGTAGGVKDTQAAGSLTADQQAFLCGLDANYDNKSRGDHNYKVTIPKP
ncbi:prealbumin-like fold domain-containing protein [Nocardioides bigeumensis]|uniref:SpaA-like prealbumin fold domain-containing protein n=1 Tax=Nocardioides bigeumensis TaxID=433657 RepID=A0ABP5JGA5_9ACTN